ncbi:hypothetical protein [Muricauda sp. MAR_2010_75]|uniref:hypothetical protein n=1 Tax=Allomuricauda sp. MAR_2010_75 TaxID=1250232 RepID=UPI0005678180|nr:hypothetical protein [Muricauda sp. MAR_2010_75]
MALVNNQPEFHGSPHLDFKGDAENVRDLQNVLYCRLVNYVKNQNPDVDIPKEKFDFFMGEYYKGIDQIFTKGEKS